MSGLLPKFKLFIVGCIERNAVKRSGKFYRKNEKSVMKELGFEPTPNSGAGWVVKEDGQNENAICQLKSTDANSIRINLDDIHTLQYNASIEHKIPVFAIQFLKTNEVFLLIKSTDVNEMIDFIKTGERKEVLGVIENVGEVNITKDKIRSSKRAKEEFKREMENKYKKRKSAL